jgi:hypothetical protein
LLLNRSDVRGELFRKFGVGRLRGAIDWRYQLLRDFWSERRDMNDFNRVSISTINFCVEAMSNRSLLDLEPF